ncbi:MAG: type II toxin-antitoxin system Phd/YefM family antitoxin [Pyrinomonadaceae bacterium]
MQQVTVKEAQTILSSLIQAAIDGEEVVIKCENQIAVKLVIVEKEKSRRKIGLAKGLITMREDFDEPLEDFEEYM